MGSYGPDLPFVASHAFHQQIERSWELFWCLECWWEYLEFVTISNVDDRNFTAGNNRKKYCSELCTSLVPTTIKFSQIMLTSSNFKDEAYEVLRCVDDFEK